MSLVQAGDQVRIHYTVRLADGSAFFSTHNQGSESAPQALTAGSDEVIRGISEAVIGMRVGERKLVQVEPDAAFGARDPALEQRVPLSKLPPGARVGEWLEASSDANSIPVKVVSIEGDSAWIDANHPLSGHPLILEIELVSFLPSSR